MIDNNTYNMKAYLQKTDTKMSGPDSKNKFQISILKDMSNFANWYFVHSIELQI